MHEKVLIDLHAYISMTDNEVRGKKEIIKVEISKFIIYLIYILWSWPLKAMYLLNGVAVFANFSRGELWKKFGQEIKENVNRRKNMVVCFQDSDGSYFS